MNDDIFNQMGYDMPADVPESASAESFEYYRHPSGMYLSVIGKLRFKYRDLEGKNCEPTTPGAKLHNAVLPLWLKKFLGSASKPESYSILGDKLEIPSDFNGKELQSAMLYYPVIISFAAQDQWKNIQIFENFNIPTVKEE